MDENQIQEFKRQILAAPDKASLDKVMIGKGEENARLAYRAMTPEERKATIEMIVGHPLNVLTK